LVKRFFSPIVIAQKSPFLTLALALAIDTLPIGVRGVEGAFLAIYSRG